MTVVLIAGPTATQNAPFLPLRWPKPIASTHCTYL